MTERTPITPAGAPADDPPVAHYDAATRTWTYTDDMQGKSFIACMEGIYVEHVSVPLADGSGWTVETHQPPRGWTIPVETKT